jgi:hypothetical protein
VAASDYLPHAIWARKLLERQGYIIKENKVYQDNQSAIQIEKNGRKSCGPNSRHIDIGYFFIKDRLEIEGFNVEYCPTEQMLADFFTKPLQGNLFRRLREVIIGRKHIDALKEFTSAKSQERVGEDIVSMKNVTMADVRSSDVKARRPHSRKTYRYAQAARKQPKRGRVSFERETRKKHHGLTHKKQSYLTNDISIISIRQYPRIQCRKHLPERYWTGGYYYIISS